MDFEIVKADHDDISDLCIELKQLSEYYAVSPPPYKDEGTSRKVLEYLIDSHLILKASFRTELVGFIGGFITQHVFNPDITVLSECFWWTKPAFRGSGVGGKLLTAFEKWGAEHADWIIMTIESGAPLDDALFLKRGYRMKEKTYLLEVK